MNENNLFLQCHNPILVFSHQEKKNQTLVTHKNIVNFILCDVPAAYFLVIANKF